MEHSAGTSASPRTSGSILSAILFVVAYFGARGVLEFQDVGTVGRVLAALVPVIPFAWMLWSIIAGVRAMDELVQRIQLEALVLAFPLTLILLMTLGLLEIALKLPPADLSYRHVWAMLPIFYVGGLLLARKRYQ